MRLALIGKPGSGKTVQAEIVAKEFGLPMIAVGEELRRLERSRTALGAKIRHYIDRGLLVPNEIVLGIVRARLAKRDCAAGFVFDGFPRNLGEARALARVVPVDAIIDVVVPDSEIVRRLSARRECVCGEVYNMLTKRPKRNELCDRCGRRLYVRPDDRPAVIRRRLAVYRLKTAPLLNYYRKQGLLIKVDGRGKIKEVAKRIITALKRLR